MKNSVPRDWDEIKAKLHQKNDELVSILDKIESTRNEAYLSEQTVKRFKTFKDLEDLTTFATITLLSTCIVFMIVVNSDWNFYFLDFFNVSRFLFGASFLFLLIRVFLRTKDLTHSRL